MKTPFSFLLIACLAAALPAAAADFADPTWPCIQRKVENLSPGLMWALPPDAAQDAPDAKTQQDIQALADALSLRRIAIEEIQPEIDAFAARHDGNAALLGQVFTAVFDPLNKRRNQIIKGIADFSLSQIALAENIETLRATMATEISKTEPDYDKIDAVEEQLDWDQVIYTDRQQSIQYLCETPVLIERRLFDIARRLQEAAAS